MPNRLRLNRYGSGTSRRNVSAQSDIIKGTFPSTSTPVPPYLVEQGRIPGLSFRKLRPLSRRLAPSLAASAIGAIILGFQVRVRVR